MTPIRCPSCGVALGAPDELIGQQIKCGQCNHTFLASAEPAAAPPAPPKPTPVDPQIRPAFRGQDVEYVGGFDRQAAQQKVQTPGLLLMIAGGLFVLGGLGFTVFAVIGLLELGGHHVMDGNENQKDAVIMTLCGIVGTAVLLAMGLIMIMGGHHLRSLTSRGWVMTAAIVPIIVVGLGCTPLLLPMLGLCIWVLVVVNDSNVRQAMDTQGQPGR